MHATTWIPADRIGEHASRAAAQYGRRARRFGRAFVREWSAADTARAFHAIAFPDAYAPVEVEVEEIRPVPANVIPWHPRRADAISGAILPTVEANGHGMTTADRLSWDLEAQADAILRAAGDDVHRVDHRDRNTRQMTVNPDRIAHRGAPVHTLPVTADSARAVSTRKARVRVRYSLTGPTVRTSFRLVESTGDPCDAWADAMLGVARVGRVSELETVQLRGHRSRFRIIGHGPAIRIDDATTRRTARRRAAAAPRPTGAGKRGKASDPMTMNTGSLRRRWARATDEQRTAADRLVSILATTVPETALRTNRGTVVVLDGATVAPAGGTAMTFHEYARRAVLATIDIED